MKRTKKEKIPVFTLADHLKVQEQIEQRAYELWLGGCSHQNETLENWVRAEREVLEEFIRHLLKHIEMIDADAR